MSGLVALAALTVGAAVASQDWRPGPKAAWEVYHVIEGGSSPAVGRAELVITRHASSSLQDAGEWTAYERHTGKEITPEMARSTSGDACPALMTSLSELPNQELGRIPGASSYRGKTEHPVSKASVVLWFTAPAVPNARFYSGMIEATPNSDIARWWFRTKAAIEPCLKAVGN